MSMGDVELLGLYWTVSGPVVVHVGREWSYFSWADRCAQAKRVGYAGLGLWHADIEHQLSEGHTLKELKQTFDDAGLKHIELEFLMDWFVDEGEEGRAESDRMRKLLFDAAAELDAHHIKVGNIPGTPCEIPKLTERFADLCADAAQRHNAKIVYEFMPFDVNVNDLDTAIKLVVDAGAPNSGLAIDTWHMRKLGIQPNDLRRVPLEYLSWIELSDGQYENMEDPIDEVVNHRKLPGEGEFNVSEYVDVIRDMGYPGPWGVEVLSEDLRNRPIEEIFDKSYEATAAQFRAGVA
jgi:sugar phosphate isomerase/epimerase